MLSTVLRRSARIQRRAATQQPDVHLQAFQAVAIVESDLVEPQEHPRRKRARKTGTAPTGAVEPAAATALLDKESSATSSTNASGPSRCYEEELWEAGYPAVAGVDEAGRGPLAGPVVAAACIIPRGVTVEGIDDSKKVVSEQRREDIYERLVATPGVAWAV